MKTKLMMIGALAAICTAHELAAMPTRAETARAESAVRSLMASDHAALRARKKTHSEVADAAMKHADEAASEAKKLLLMKGAFSLYVRAGEYDRAIETIEKMQAAIPDMPDENVISIIKSSLRNVSRNEGKVLYAFLDDIKARSRKTDNVRNSAANVKYKFDYRLEDGMAVLTGIDPKPVGVLVVPDKIDGHLVTRIEGYNNRSPFWECDRLTKIVLPAGLKFDSFDAGVFISCKSLSSIDIAKSNKDFTSLDGVLYSKDLSTLCVYPKTRDSIKLSPKTKKVGVCAFRGCALKTAKIPEGIEEIERWNLCECPNLESIEFPKSLKRLGACAACGDENLRKIVFYGDAPHADVVHYTSGLTQEVFTGAPENLVVEVRRGSKGWKSPDSTDLPELWPVDQKEARPICHIKSGRRNADGGGKNASNVKYKFNYKLEDGGAVLTGISPKPVGTLVVPDKIDGHLVTRIENYNEFSPFWGCDQLTKVVLPAGLKFGSCDGGPFMSCKSLATIDVAEGNKELTSRDGALYSKDLSTLCVYPKTRESVELPPETKKVQVCAFRGCALKTAKIPEGVEEIERWNLCECQNLELIEFPKSLKHLGVCAAYNNKKLTKIVFYGDAPRIDGGWQEVFTGAPENLVVEVRRGSKGWLEPDSIELPELWPTDQKESRPIRYMGGEVMRPMFSGMFPGWQVCPEAGREIGIVSNHRGQDDVAFVHPISPERPAVVSNTLTLSNGNPCLYLKMASFGKDYDFLLSVLVNGKEVLPKRLICTPDSEPWQDITIPLTAWRGQKVKIEIVLAANNWYCEHPFFKRLEVAEGTGQEKLDIEAIGKESGRQAFSRLFPGWETSVEPGTSPSHRGQDDVVFVHPPSPETPAVVSNTLTLSNGNPCLYLKMASFGKDYDFLLSVLVNGKEVLPKRLICTPDSEPWQDITIPLTAWRGQKVKIEIVLAANNWYCEHPFFKRLEVAEGTGQEKLDSKLEHDAKETVNGYTWSYRVNNGEAMIVAEKDGNHSCAVSPMPTGDVSIPATLGGVKVTGIGAEAFRNCNDLTSVTVPEGVTHIDTHALAYCRGLQSVTLPSSLRDIGYAAFGKDAELKSVTIPNGVKSIAADAFNGCGLKSVIIPESVMHIGDRAFCECGALESVAISAGVASIGNGVFGGCNALKLITVDSGNQAFTAVDGVLYTKDRSELVMWPNPPKSVVIPDGVTKIRGWALAGGSGMTSVTIPESVTSIEDHVFLGCDGLKSITIPSSIKNIGERAFEGSRELTEMTMLGERPEAKDLFPGCGKLKAIHVPANAKSWAGMKEWHGIPLVYDAGRQTQTENAEPWSSLLNRRRLVRDRIREEEVRRREAEQRAQEERQRREAEQRAQEEEWRQREAERAEQRRQLEQIREELRKAREERKKAEQAAAQQR